MDNARLKQLLCESLLYIVEIRERETEEERENFFEKVIGLTPKELKELEEFGFEV